MSTLDTSSRRFQEVFGFTDDLLFRHTSRAVNVEMDPVNPVEESSIPRLPDFVNNNYVTQLTRHDPSQANEVTLTNQSPGNVDTNLKSNSAQEFATLRYQLDSSHRSFRDERRKFFDRITQLENDLESLNNERQEEEARQNQNIRELDDRLRNLSDELTRALLKNVQLVEENSALKTTQLNLSTRMNSMEEKLQHLEDPNQDNIKTVVKRLEKREANLKNQAKRLAQLESYYTRELNVLSVAGGRGPIPELQREEPSVIQIHPQPQQYGPSHHQSPKTSHQIDPRLAVSPMTNKNYIPAGRNSYRELYYKTITDKAINLIQREACNCNTLLQKFSKPTAQKFSPAPTGVTNGMASSASTLNASSSEMDFETKVTRKVLDSTERIPIAQARTASNEEDEILSLLFFKF